MQSLILIAFVCLFAGCASPLQPGFGERDKFVINTPEYPDNKVYYVEYDESLKSKYLSKLKLSYDIDQQTIDRNKLIDREPISIVANSVGIPYTETGVSKDIAVLLEINADTNTESQPIVIWYQRNVLPGQSLNFSNLLIYSQDKLDNRIAPFFRIRVIDVASEKNLETREVLSEVSRYGNSVAISANNPILSPIFAVASKAASLVLASRENKMLLDYSVQFYPSNIKLSSENPNLSPLIKGRFVLVGRSKLDLKNKDYWKKIKQIDELNSVVYVDDKLNNNLELSPLVSLEILDNELAVLPLVAARSAYLTKLLSDSTLQNTKEIISTSNDLNIRIKAYAYKESIQRNRLKSDISDIVRIISSTTSPAPPDLVADISRYLRKISGCEDIPNEYINDWWNKNSSNIDFLSDKKVSNKGKLLNIVNMDYCKWE
jgi:hypothetical protein